MDWNLIVGVVSMASGVAAAYLGYVAIRTETNRRRISPSAPALPPGTPEYDVFVSYADTDEDKAEWLAAGLLARGLRVFLAKWIGCGLVEYAEKEQALLTTANGVLLFSHATMTRPDIRDEYAALLQRAHSGGRRFVPVLVEDVELPPFARIRKPLNLVDQKRSETQLDELARAVGPPRE